MPSGWFGSWATEKSQHSGPKTGRPKRDRAKQRRRRSGR